MGLGWTNDWIAPADLHPLNFRFNIVSDLMGLFKRDNVFEGAVNPHPQGLTVSP